MNLCTNEGVSTLAGGAAKKKQLRTFRDFLHVYTGAQNVKKSSLHWRMLIDRILDYHELLHRDSHMLLLPRPIPVLSRPLFQVFGLHGEVGGQEGVAFENPGRDCKSAVDMAPWHEKARKNAFEDFSSCFTSPMVELAFFPDGCMPRFTANDPRQLLSL